ncbi:hypothetical protein EAG_11983 [Camponotus floridanus]|uniref:Uncharacterized protein n=1 Tax=Camponotus floridanus TaxID=104421 RepID=E2AA66_CAMFO|nr:hypothetical protein EAG_11983 [Camponotus floridanus]
MGIALPWERAVRDHNANQPVDVSLCTLYDCSTPLLKGPWSAPYFLVAHARRPPAYGSLSSPLWIHHAGRFVRLLPPPPPPLPHRADPRSVSPTFQHIVGLQNLISRIFVPLIIRS